MRTAFRLTCTIQYCRTSFPSSNELLDGLVEVLLLFNIQIELPFIGAYFDKEDPNNCELMHFLGRVSILSYRAIRLHHIY
jgi:hypothetical protein